VVTWRSDFGAPTAEDAFGPDALGPPIDWGVELPEGTQAIRVDGLVVPDSWADIDRGAHADPLRLMARFVDDRGRFRIYAASMSFTDEGWATVEIPLAGGAALNGPFPDIGTLVLQSVWLERDALTGNPLETGQVLVSGWEAVTAEGTSPIGDAITSEFTGQAGMSAGEVDGSYAADRYYEAVPPGEPIPTHAVVAASPYNRPGRVQLWAFPGRNRAQPVPHLRRDTTPLDFVVDRDVASVAGLSLGTTVVFGVEDQTVDGTVTGIVDLIPTTGDPTLDGAIVARLDGVLQLLSSDPSWSLSGTLSRVETPQELWLSTDDPNGTLRVMLSEYQGEPDLAVAATGVSADFSSRPIQVGLVSILFLGTGAGVVLALAGVTGYVLVAVRRRYREMGVLRALGFRRRGVAGTFALEQVVVLGLGALVGVGAGIGLMRLMIPFLQLGEEARDLVPPAVMVIPLAQLGIYLGIVAGLLVVSVLWSTRSVSARRLSEVLREVER
jgi:hypothetical protein